MFPCLRENEIFQNHHISHFHKQIPCVYALSLWFVILTAPLCMVDEKAYRRLLYRPIL